MNNEKKLAEVKKYLDSIFNTLILIDKIEKDSKANLEKYYKLKSSYKRIKKQKEELEASNNLLIKEVDRLNEYINEMEKYN